MKLGIISDIHANLEALEAVIGALRNEGATEFVCCGDIVGYGPDPNRCVDIVRDLGCVGVAGNHDYGVVGYNPLADFNPAARLAALWTRPLLTEQNRHYLASLPLKVEKGPLLIVHSSPSEPEIWEYVLTVREAADEIDCCSAGACVVGHSHQPLAVERLSGGEARPVRQYPFLLRSDARYFINAGSVGQPRDGDPRACCLLYDGDARTMACLRVSYDIPAVQAKIRAAGLPEHLAARLATGR